MRQKYCTYFCHRRSHGVKGGDGMANAVGAEGVFWGPHRTPWTDKDHALLKTGGAL